MTGETSVINGHPAEAFLRDSHGGTVLDNVEPFYTEATQRHTLKIHRELVDAGDIEYRLVEDDVRNAETVGEVVDDADVMVHQAAQADVRENVQNPRRVTGININETMNLLETATEMGVNNMIFASSLSVYGKPRSLPYEEDHLTTPISPYGASKLAAQHYVRVYNEVYGLPTVSLRYFTVYGPRMRPNMAVTNFVSRCLHGEPLVVCGDGS